MQALIRYYNDAFDACMAPLAVLGGGRKFSAWRSSWG